MSKERELLGRWHNGDLLPEEYMQLMKETKELLAQPDQTEQEPVATKLESHQFTAFHVSALDFKKLQKLPIGTKLYTAPPKREPLSEDKLDALAEANITDEGIAGYYLGFRDAEKMHGIGGGV